MKKLIFTFLLFVMVSTGAFAQRIVFNQTFQGFPITADSLPLKWTKVITLPPTTQPTSVWAIRDSGNVFQGVNQIVRSPAYQSTRALTVPWSGYGAGGIIDQWVFTDSFTVKTGDSLIFMMVIGTPAWVPSLTAYIDTMQVHVCLINDPAGSLQKLATIKSRDSAGVALGGNVWEQYKFNLTPFAGQIIYVGFRYYMDTNIDGLWCCIDNVFVGNRAASVVNQIGTGVPTKYNMEQNYPNPFNPSTSIKFALPKASNVKITVFNMLGQVVSVPVNENKSAGFYEVKFNGSNLASGSYYYRIEAGSYVETKKMMLIK